MRPDGEFERPRPQQYGPGDEAKKHEISSKQNDIFDSPKSVNLSTANISDIPSGFLKLSFQS